MSSSYRLELDRWLGQLDIKADTVIDIGGAQLPVKGRTKSWDVGNYEIWDLENPHKGDAKPDRVYDVESHPWIKEPEIADVVFCLEVMDYVILPTTALLNIMKPLKPGGIAYVTFPFIYPTHQPVEHEGLRYTENSIYRLCERWPDIEVISIQPRRPETDLLNQFYRAERMRAAKHYDHQVTGWIATLRKT